MKAREHEAIDPLEIIEKLQEENKKLREALEEMECSCHSYGGVWQKCPKCQCLESITHN